MPLLSLICALLLLLGLAAAQEASIFSTFTWYTEASDVFSLSVYSADGDGAGAVVCPGTGDTRVTATVAPSSTLNGDTAVMLMLISADADSHTLTGSAEPDSGAQTEYFSEIDFNLTLTATFNCFVVYGQAAIAGTSLEIAYAPADPAPTSLSTVTSYAVDSDGMHYYNDAEGSFDATLDSDGEGGL
ncbi:hypothetical protein KIPB_001649 [Kipferlia bialata]|uniref:DOMON domain-containing protein n=1 Tax=Kipferlia bialata TaxID=797122 RepID=A0A9K3CP02_9EUKA|nr:hypothetical protein KIPB_001649 [Kipferlia bialata]|eukprot:g1649.t1